MNAQSRGNSCVRIGASTQRDPTIAFVLTLATSCPGMTHLALVSLSH